jgi:hypothetical protein
MGHNEIFRYKNDNEIIWGLRQGNDRVGGINWEHTFPEDSLTVPLSKPYIAAVQRSLILHIG